MIQAPELRRDAAGLAAPLPALLADARKLASTVLWGDHGRRRAGAGEEFWQYRHAGPSDGARAIDWRRSARDDSGPFVREREWQAAQTINLWVDSSQSMGFSSTKGTPSKAYRSMVLGTACADLLLRGGERVGLAGSQPADPSTVAARSGRAQLDAVCAALCAGHGSTRKGEDYSAPNINTLPARSCVVLLSDFLGDFEAIVAAVGAATDRGIQGVLVQVLDPAEETFPYDGRTRFASMSGALTFESRKAGGLRTRYLDRLAERKTGLADLARQSGWQYYSHHTDVNALPALTWMYEAIRGPR